MQKDLPKVGPIRSQDVFYLGPTVLQNLPLLIGLLLYGARLELRGLY